MSSLSIAHELRSCQSRHRWDTIAKASSLPLSASALLALLCPRSCALGLGVSSQPGLVAVSSKQSSVIGLQTVWSQHWDVGTGHGSWHTATENAFPCTCHIPEMRNVTLVPRCQVRQWKYSTINLIPPLGLVLDAVCTFWLHPCRAEDSGIKTEVQNTPPPRQPSEDSQRTGGSPELQWRG